MGFENRFTVIPFGNGPLASLENGSEDRSKVTSFDYGKGYENGATATSPGKGFEDRSTVTSSGNGKGHGNSATATSPGNGKGFEDRSTVTPSGNGKDSEHRFTAASLSYCFLTFLGNGAGLAHRPTVTSLGTGKGPPAAARASFTVASNRSAVTFGNGFTVFVLRADLTVFFLRVEGPDERVGPRLRCRC